MSYYHHTHFVRGHRELVRHMVRCKIKGPTISTTTGRVVTTTASSHGGTTTSPKSTTTKRRRCSLESFTVAIATTARPISRRQRASQSGLGRSLRHSDNDSKLDSSPLSLSQRRKRLQTNHPDTMLDKNVATLSHPSIVPSRLVSVAMSSPDLEDCLNEPRATTTATTMLPPCNGDLVYFEGSPFYYLESTASLLDEDSANAMVTATALLARPAMMDDQGDDATLVHCAATAVVSNRYPIMSSAPWPLFPSLTSSERSESNQWCSTTSTSTSTTTPLDCRMGPACQLRPRYTTTTMAQRPWEQTSIQWMC
jgi:hypothetical protein